MIKSVTVRNVANCRDDFLKGNVFSETIDTFFIRTKFGLTQAQLDEMEEYELFDLACQVLNDEDLYTDQAKLDEVW